MAQRSSVSSRSSASVKPAVENTVEETTINIIAVYPSILKYTGRVSGKSYRWDGAGDIQAVDERDVPDLLAKRIGHRGCCGAVNQEGNKVFDKA